MQMPVSPISFSKSPLAFSSAPRRRGNKIDYSKAKTKMCRNFLRGIPCPFEDQCAFLHGKEEEMLSSTNVCSPLSMTKESESISSLPSSHQHVNRCGVESYFAVDSDSILSSDYTAPPPPAYADAIRDEIGANTDSYLLPPAYSRRYRHDPYSFVCLAFQE